MEEGGAPVLKESDKESVFSFSREAPADRRESPHVSPVEKRDGTRME